MDLLFEVILGAKSYHVMLEMLNFVKVLIKELNNDNQSLLSYHIPLLR